MKKVQLFWQNEPFFHFRIVQVQLARFWLFANLFKLVTRFFLLSRPNSASAENNSHVIELSRDSKNITLFFYKKSWKKSENWDFQFSAKSTFFKFEFGFLRQTTNQYLSSLFSTKSSFLFFKKRISKITSESLDLKVQKNGQNKNF